MRLSNTAQKLIILGLPLLAFFLRAYRLDGQSYWIDEAWSVYFANLSPAELWHLLTTAEPLPPFYHPSTLYWIRAVGDSEYAMRFFSLIFGVMAVPFTYRLGKDLGDERLGLAAALLVTIAPYQIWHSQEARMYSALTAASVMSMWGFVNMWQRCGRRWWLVYVLGTVWAIMTHYHGAVLIGVQGLFLLLTWRRHWRIYLKWGATLVVILLLQAPWLIFGGNLLQSYLNWIEQPTLMESFIRSAKAYSLSEMVPQPQAIPLMLVFVAMYILGLVYAATRRWGTWRGPEMLALLLSFTIAPNIAAWLYGEFQTTVYFERYLIMVQIGYLLTVACGILGLADQFWRKWRKTPAILHRIPVWLARPVAALMLLLLVSIEAWVLYHHYFDPLYAKPDWRAVAKTVATFGQPDDAILLTGDGGELAFNYYYQGDLPVYHPYNISPHIQNQQRLEGDAALQKLANITGSHQRLWYTPYGMHLDPMLESWLAENSYPAWQSWLGRKRLALYDTQPKLNRRETLRAVFIDASGQGPILIDVTLPSEPITAGDLLSLTSTWQTDTPLAHDYQISLRLTNKRSDTFAQSDWPPLSAQGKTSTWPANQPITDRRSLWLPPDTPPGIYLLQLVLYDSSSGQAVGQPVAIDGIGVAPATSVIPPQALPIPNLIQNPKSEIRNPFLLGYALPSEIQPGQEMWLWLYWQASPAFSVVDAATLRISLRGKGEISSTDVPLTEALGSLDTWLPGQIRRAVYHLPTSPRLNGDTAELNVSLISEQGIETETPVAEVKLKTRERQFESPSVAHPVDFSFGNPVSLKLIGYDLTGRSTQNLTLYWQAIAEMEINYTVFVQMLNGAGQVVAQVDLQPQAGNAPTTTWLPGEVLADPYTLTPPSTLPPAEYRLIAGMYNAATGQRLPVSSGGDFVELQTVTVQ